MNIKTSKEEILNIIENDIVIYLRSGKLSIHKYLDDINLNINNREKLLQIHFLLDIQVRNYILNLNRYMKKFNVSTKKEENIIKGKIKGNVLWNKTFKARNNINPKDKTIFVCNENYKNYNTKENLVLKKLVSILYNLFNMDGIEEYNKFAWFESRKELKRELENIYFKNIYLSKIDLKSIVLDNRAIESVSKSRNELYRETAKLLKYYNRVMGYDKDIIKEVLSNTFIDLAEDSTLFELYWVLKIIKDNSENAKLNILDNKSDKVAEWEKDNNIYTIYHNSSGSSEISFNIELDEIRGIKNEFIERKIKSVQDTNLIAKELFPKIKQRYNYLFNGRPDIIIEIRSKDNMKVKKVVLCEVKYTTSQDYAIEGLKELLEYINFVKMKINNNYEYIKEEVEVRGILLLDNMKVGILNNPNIKVITMRENNKEMNIDF